MNADLADNYGVFFSISNSAKSYRSDRFFWVGEGSRKHKNYVFMIF